MADKVPILGPEGDAEIDEELRFHLEMKEAELREGGMTPEQARRAAAESFGDPARVRRWLRRHDRRKRNRRERRDRVHALLLDLRYAVRKLVKRPGLAAAIAVTLGVGIGGTTAMFSVVDALLLRPLPFLEPERLVLVDLYVPVAVPDERPKSSPDVTDLENLRHVFSDFATYAPGGLNLTGLGEPERVRVALVTPSFFSTLGVVPAIGRPFGGDAASAAPRPAILAHGLARRAYADPADAIGAEIELHGRAYEVVGTMPPGFAFPNEADVWLPMPIPFPLEDAEPFGQYLPALTVGRLAPGVSIEEAERRVRDVYAPYPLVADRLADGASPLVVPLREELVQDRRTGVVMLFGVTLLVLLVACANVANLLLARSTEREPEIAMRRLLGASRFRMLQQLAVESLLLAALGGALGVAVAWLALPPLRTLVPEHLAGAITIALDLRVLAFSVVIVVGTALAFGLWPVIGAWRVHPAEASRSAGSWSTAHGRAALVRRSMVVAEIAVAVVVLVATGTMLRSVATLLSTDAGIRPEGVASLQLSLARSTYRNAEERSRFVREVLERLAADPRVEAAAFANEMLLGGSPGVGVTVRPEGAEDWAPWPMAQDLRVTPDYFRALGIPVLRGRAFDPSPPAGVRELIVNEMLADRLFPGEDPIGKRLEGAFGVAEVVGVVANVKSRSLEARLGPQTYANALRAPFPSLALVARSSRSSDELGAILVEAVRAVDPTQAVYNVKSMEEVIAGPIAPRRTSTVLLSFFGLVALLLAVVGVYGVTAYDVARRTREFGIRLALGAKPAQLLRAATADGLLVGLIGVACGLGGAWFLSRGLESLVYGIPPRDPVSFVTAPSILVVAALVGVLLPSLRALCVDPAVTMRAE